MNSRLRQIQWHWGYCRRDIDVALNFKLTDTKTQQHTIKYTRYADFVDALPTMDTEPRLNIKTVLSTYGDIHVKDKTAVRTSYL